MEKSIYAITTTTVFIKNPLLVTFFEKQIKKDILLRLYNHHNNVWQELCPLCFSRNFDHTDIVKFQKCFQGGHGDYIQVAHLFEVVECH